MIFRHLRVARQVRVHGPGRSAFLAAEHLMEKRRLAPARLVALGAVIAAMLSATPAGAQLLRTNTARASMPSYGMILGVSALSKGTREPTGNIYVLGNVTVRHNGPWRLQVKLTTPFVDKAGNKVKATNEVRVLLANGSYATVTTGAWVTIHTGAGTLSIVKPVKYYIVWGQSSAKNPDLAVQIPVTYQVVPL